MGREYSLEDALKLAIKAEKDSMDFYARAASVAKTSGQKRFLSYWRLKRQPMSNTSLIITRVGSLVI